MRSYQIVAGLNKRDPEVVGQVWMTYYPLVSGIISRLTNRSPDTKDMVSDTLTGLIRHKGQFESVEKIRSFLITSARNACLNHLNHLRIVQSRSSEIEYHYQNIDSDDMFDAEAYASLRVSIYQGIEKLRPKCKEVFMLYYFKRLKNREIAERLGISEKAVEKRKTKAYHILKMEIKPANRFIFSILFL
jgi:RNA polymerase sigma factor (sigma-70 family)